MRRLATRPEFVSVVLLALAVGLASYFDPRFLDAGYLLDTSSLYAEEALLALGMTLVIVAREIDLSPAANMALVACVVAKLAADGMPVGEAAALGVALGGVLGAANGALVAYVKMPSFLVTLGTLALYRGAAQALTGPDSIRLPDSFVGVDRFRLAVVHIPLPLLAVLGFAALVAVLLHRTIFGRWVFAVGLNEEAARFSAVPVAAVKLAVFTLLGLLAGVAGLMIDSRLGVARSDHANGLELDVITATVLGGASIAGGKGTVAGTLVAVALLAVARTAMGLADVATEYQLAVVGALLVAAVLASGGLERSALAWRRTEGKR